MLNYYEARRPEYEEIYNKPERQEDLKWLENEVCDLVDGLKVFELACGTGYWTRHICKNAKRVHATDASLQLVESTAMSISDSNVTFEVVDALSIPSTLEYNCCLACFFYSHVPKSSQHKFLKGISDALPLNTLVILFDNNFVEQSSSPISKMSSEGDTFQNRKLSNGKVHEVLKNFPTEEQLKKTLSHIYSDVRIKQSQYFWLCSCMTRS